MLTAAAGYSQCNTGCPPCYQNGPLAGSGPADDGSGRRTLLILIDSTEIDPSTGQTYTDIWNGVNDATAAWNAQTNGASCGNAKTGYYFKVDQNTSQPDIIVTDAGATPTHCRENAVGLASGARVRPDTIRLARNYRSSTGRAEVARVVEHELGHSIGLLNSQDAACGTGTGANSIMGIVSPLVKGCIPPNGYAAVLTANDVLRSNVALNTPGSCNSMLNATTQNDPTYDASCPDTTSFGCISYFGGNAVEIDQCQFSGNGCPSGYYFQSAGGGNCCTPYPSPVIIDLNGDGFDLTDAAHGVDFDFFGNGHPIRIAWTAPKSDDAWLVLDRNGNGTIDSAHEMFGNITQQSKSANPNGFLALAEFDQPANGGNADGMISSADAIYSRLRLWSDKNHDGISQPGELMTLQDAGVVSISLDFHLSKWEDLYGNAFRFRAKLTRTHGSDLGQWSYDVFLKIPE